MERILWFVNYFRTRLEILRLIFGRHLFFQGIGRKYENRLCILSLCPLQWKQLIGQTLNNMYIYIHYRPVSNWLTLVKIHWITCVICVLFQHGLALIQVSISRLNIQGVIWLIWEVITQARGSCKMNKLVKYMLLNAMLKTDSTVNK